MWPGMCFRLTAKILAVKLAGTGQPAEYIPQGEIVVVLEGPQPNDIGLVDVRWDDRAFCVFLTDLEARAVAVRTA